MKSKSKNMNFANKVEFWNAGWNGMSGTCAFKNCISWQGLKLLAARKNVLSYKLRKPKKFTRKCLES